MSRQARILVVIPAYNEAANIAEVTRRVKSAAPSADVLVIDDGSRDATADIAASAGAEVVSHPFNMGYGVAIQTGYKYALRQGYDYLVQIDGDGQHDPAYIQKLLAPVQADEVDFALGSRFHGEGSYRPPLARRIGMAFFRKIVNLIVGGNITDCTSGFQAFNRDVIRFLSSDLFPVDYPDADVLITLHRADFTLQEIPVRMFSDDGQSMHSGIRPVYYIFKMLLSILVTQLRSRKFYMRERTCR